MNVIIEKYENGKKLIGTNNTQLIHGLKTIKGISNRIKKSDISKNLKKNQLLKISSYINIYDETTYKGMFVYYND